MVTLTPRRRRPGDAFSTSPGFVFAVVSTVGGEELVVRFVEGSSPRMQRVVRSEVDRALSSPSYPTFEVCLRR